MTTVAELALLRTHPQEVDLRMSIYRPQTALACVVNDSTITRNARTITFDTVSVGAYGNVKAGMTMFVGTSAGACDIGIIRVRSASATQIVVAENSDIAWSDGLFLTVLKFFDVVPIFPRIIQNPSNLEDVIFYKDYDIAYTNQNTIMGTLVNMGSHQAVELSGGSATIAYSATGSYNVNGDILTYLWDFEGASSPTGSTSISPGNVSYNTAGNYLTALTVTSNTGAVDTSYRYIVVDEPGGGIIDWRIEGLQGSRESGGYTANIVINSYLGHDITPGTAIIITSKEWYGTTQQNIGGNVFFVGYVLQDTIKYDYNKSSVEFQIGSISELMKLSSGFAISVEDNDAPSTWYQIKNLNMCKAMYHYWKWHSTLLMTTDVQFIGTDILQQFFDCNKESMYDAISSVLKSARIGELVSDRKGKLWAEISAKATADALTAFPSDFIISNDDWIGEPTIQENVHNKSSYMEMGGILYNKALDEPSVPLLACAPGYSPTTRGKSQPITGLALSGQTQLNELVGDVFINSNTRYPFVSLDLRGSYKNVDIAPQKAVTLIVQQTDTAKHIAITAPYFPSSSTWNYNHETRYLLQNITINAITDGTTGETLVIPKATDPDFLPGFSVPDFNMPNFPTIKFPTITFPGVYVPPITIVPPLGIVAINFTSGVWLMDYVHNPSVWTQVIPTAACIASFPTFTRINDFVLSGTGVAYFSVVDTSNTIHNILSSSILSGVVSSVNVAATEAWFQSQGIDGNPWGWLIYTSGFNPGTADVVFGAGHGYPWGMIGIFMNNNLGTMDRKYLVESDFNYGYLTPLMGRWYLTGNAGFGLRSEIYRFDGGLVGASGPAPTSWGVGSGVTSSSVFSVAASDGLSDILYASVNNGNNHNMSRYNPKTSSVSTTIESDISYIPEGKQSFDCDPSGVSVMTTALRKSGDQGNSWSSCSQPPSLSYDGSVPWGINNQKIKNMGDSYKWMYTFTANVYLDPGVITSSYLHIFYTSDFGAHWIDWAFNLHETINTVYNLSVGAIRNA